MLDGWHQAAMTTLGLFWMAFWAFGLGYLLSSMIQVFVTRERMQKTMGRSGPRSIALGSLFGFLSSSCSFAALATTRSLFAKGAGLAPALAFLLASTNLVIELGIVIAVFLGWQFVVGEYVGGVLLILLTWGILRLVRARRLVAHARERARSHDADSAAEQGAGWQERIRTIGGWRDVADRYLMEWQMVWKDVTVGFTAAGAIAYFVPRGFFEALFVGAGASDPSFGEVLLQSLTGPAAAFFTFIGSMGNIPLAAVLHGHGVSFAGVMAFIFSDLVVLPVVRIQARYYGWRMALFIVAVFLAALVVAAVMLHYAFAALDILPAASAGRAVTGRDYFAIDHTLVLNGIFIGLTIVAVAWRLRAVLTGSGNQSLADRILLGVAACCLVWLGIGVTIPLVQELPALL